VTGRSFDFCPIYTAGVVSRGMVGIDFWCMYLLCLYVGANNKFNITKNVHKWK
jgi:hypothetical protein